MEGAIFSGKLAAEVIVDDYNIGGKTLPAASAAAPKALAAA